VERFKTILAQVARRFVRQDAGKPLSAPWALAGLICSLLVPSLALVHKYFDMAGMLAYLAIASSILLVGYWQRAHLRLAALLRPYALPLAALTFVGLAVLFWVSYPIVNAGVFGGGSDSDDALNMAARALLAGDYPYTQRTYLNNPISPMPGLVVLAIPAVLLGNSAYMGMVSLLAFFVVVWRYTRDGGAALVLLWLLLALAPAVLHGIVTGSDYLFNTIFLFVLFYVALWLAQSTTAPPWMVILSALLLGMGFSSRPNFVLLAPLLFAGLAASREVGFALRYMLLVGITAGAITLPFYLYDPLHFSPLHTAHKLTRFDSVIPCASMLVVGGTGLLAVWFALQPGNHNFVVLCRRAAWVLALPVVSGIVLLSIQHHTFAPDYAFFGLYFLFFGAFAFWLALGHDT
jgi:hypothetical protein